MSPACTVMFPVSVELALPTVSEVHVSSSAPDLLSNGLREVPSLIVTDPDASRLTPSSNVVEAWLRSMS